MNKIRRVYTAHTLNNIATSIIGVYIPAYLLTLGYPLSRVILFFVINHVVGLIFGFFIFVPLVQKWGLLNTFKLYYPLQILSLILLSFLKTHPFPPEYIAIVNGIAVFAYWIPMNIFLVKYSDTEKMGSSVSKFFALPSLFGIFGPLLGALLIPLVGFWPVFVLTVIGLLISFTPLAPLHDEEMKVSLHFAASWDRLKRHKILFLFEFLDNIIEESNWFWTIYVFLLIGSLATPGIVGSLEAIGGSVFTFFIGKYANKYGRKLIPIAAWMLLIITIAQMVVRDPRSAYAVTILGSFALTFFLISYFSSIYKTIKDDSEEEFLILREIPTVLGRLTVFVAIFLTISNLRLFFFLPLVVILLLLILYLFKRKSLLE